MIEPAKTLPDPLFFGLLEGLSFLCLFCSPFLFLADPSMGWVVVALLRALVLGMAILPTRACPRPAERGRNASAALRFLGQSYLYQLPFWVSALLFPLQSGQAAYAGTALLLQTALLLLLPPLANWGRPFSAESLAFGLTVLWLAIWEAPGPWLVLALLLFPLTWRPFFNRNWGWPLSLGQSLAVGLAWFAAIALPRMGPVTSIPAAPPLILWVLVLLLGVVMVNFQRGAQANGEVEVALPYSRDAQVWMTARRSAAVLIGWLALLFLLLRRPQEFVAGLLLAVAWWRAVELSARSWFNEERMVWWAAAEITLLWGALWVEPTGSYLLLATSTLLAAGLRASRSPRLPGTWPNASGVVESALWDSLTVAAPPDFVARVVAERGSVELEKDHFTASAPSGFRDRLLARLRAGEREE